MHWYVVIKTIKGHRYRYQQRTWREGTRVRTESRYLGPATGGAGDRRTMAERWDDVRSEEELIEKIFSSVSVLGVARATRQPWWKRYSTRGSFDPPDGLLDLPVQMGVIAMSRPWAGVPNPWGLQDGAWYMPDEDRLQLPEHTRFESAAMFTSVALHEMAHATGHAKRLARPKVGGDEFEEYAHEEMVADLTAHLVAYRLGWPRAPIGKAAEYVQGYLAHCSKPERARAYAEQEAKRAADFLQLHHAAVVLKRAQKRDKS